MAPAPPRPQLPPDRPGDRRGPRRCQGPPSPGSSAEGDSRSSPWALLSRGSAFDSLSLSLLWPKGDSAACCVCLYPSTGARRLTAGQEVLRAHRGGGLCLHSTTSSSTCSSSVNRPEFSGDSAAWISTVGLRA